MKNKYINKIDENFVRGFALKYGKKYLKTDRIAIVKEKNYYEVVFVTKKEGQNDYTQVRINVHDYVANSLSSFDKAMFTRAWRVALYKKFGDEYLQDLKMALNKTIEEEYKKQLRATDKIINKIKDGVFDEIVK